MRRTSLFAHGEPIVWLTGGGLAVAVVMIIGLLALVLVKGMGTFWPTPLVQIETITGERLLGEVSEEEVYTPNERVFDGLSPEQADGVRRRLEQSGGRAVRRKIRTENFDLTGEHSRWVSDFEIVGESRPEWALVVERLETGPFHGIPEAFLIDGKVVAEEPQQIWDQFQLHHGDVRERWRERQGLETHDMGRVAAREERARLAARAVELEHGSESPEAKAAWQRYEEVRQDVTKEFEAIRRRIRTLDEENARYQLRLRAADGTQKEIPLDAIVRAFPANRLGWLERLSVYLSRWWEFLTDVPRQANSAGGVYPAIFGTVAMTMIMSLLVVPFGVLAALYLREYAKQGFLISAVRIAVNNLAGVPSIVFGVFGLGFFCYVVGASVDETFFRERLPNPTYGKGGLLWASLTLALLTLPVVIVATEEALAAVPSSMREGSYACGATKWQTLRRIVLPRALPGIMTGMILAIARGAGEVAPLMLVGAVKWVPDLPIDSEFPFLHPERSFMHLGFHIYDLGFQSQDAEAAVPMVYTTTLLLIGIVVVLNAAAIYVRNRLRRRYTAG